MEKNVFGEPIKFVVQALRQVILEMVFVERFRKIQEHIQYVQQLLTSF